MKRLSCKYAHFLYVVLMGLIMTSCMEAGFPPEFKVNLFSVAGNAYDAEDGSAIQGLLVTMTAYSTDDIQMTSPLIARDVTTASDGSYYFALTLEEYNSAQLFFQFSVTDNSGRENKYMSMQRGLFLSASSRFYQPDSKSYRVTGNDFLLEVEH